MSHIKERKLIEICLQTFPVELPSKKIYQSYYFLTYKKYSHAELAEIMNKINQKYILDNDTGYMKVDFRDLSTQLRQYEIYENVTLERYMFDTMEA